MSDTLQETHQSKGFDPSDGNPFVNRASEVSRESFVKPASAAEPTLDEVGSEAQAMSDAGAMDRMAHTIAQRDAEFAPLYKGAQLAKKTAAEIAVKTVATGAGLAIAGQVVGQGIDGFLDNLDQKNQQWQQQEQERLNDQRQDEFLNGMEQGKVTINVDNPENKT